MGFFSCFRSFVIPALVASAAGLFLVCSVAAQPAPRPAGGDPPAFFPYGAMHMSTISHWQHYLPPIDEWAAYMDKDLARMKEVGFNTLAAHVDWYDIEVAPGEYDFRRLDKLMELVEKHGLKVLLWPWPELQPEWVAKVHANSQWEAADGYKPGPACWDHPEVRTAIERFVTRVVERYRDRPSVLAWDLGAEAGIWVTSLGPVDKPWDARLYCYCPHTVARYREWLQRKYGTIQKLNEVWATYHRDWQDVEPVRVGSFERAQIFWQDWRQFMLWNTADFQRIKADAARKADPHHPITCHFCGWGWSYLYACTDEYQMGRHFDVLGLSFFPFWLERSFGKYEPLYGAMMFDGLKSAAGDKPMWIEELQGGPSIYGLNYRSRNPTPADIRLWNWQAVAHGISGIFYWNWRPETTGIEASGFGLVNYDGSLTDRARAAGQVCADFQKHAARLLESRPVQAQVAILHDPRAFLQAAGEQNSGLYTNSVRGAYRAFYRATIPVDFITPEHILSGDLGRYKVVYLPFAYMLTREEGAKLAEFVRQGGWLAGALWCGLKDERTFVYETVPGAGLDEGFHCREMEVNPHAGGALKLVEEFVSLPAGAELPVHRYQEKLQVLEGGRVVAKFADGSPGLITGEYGRGRTLYVGTLLFHHYDSSHAPHIGRLLTGFARAAGVREAVRIDYQPPEAWLEARVLEGRDGRRLLIAMNHGTGVATMKARLDGQPAVSDLLTGQQLPAAADDGGTTIELNLPALDVRVLSIEPAGR